MKKNHSSLKTLICFSFLFMLNSCIANTPFLSGTTLREAVAEKVINYKSIKDDTITVSVEDLCDSTVANKNDFNTAYYVPQNILRDTPTYVFAIDVLDPVDPDWRKLVGHIITRTI